MEPGQAPGGRRKFAVPTPSEEPEAPLVRPFFKSFAAAPPPAEPGAPSPPGPSSYADYVVKQAATARAAPATALASKQGAAPEPPSPAATHSTEGCEGGPGPGHVAPSPTVKPGVRSSSIIVRPCQRGNPVLKFVRNVPWEFGDVVPDYVLGQSTCALFLSLRYHNLKPDYIHERLRCLGRTFALQILLLQVDVKDPHKALKELAKICILADCTLVLAWSPEEAGRYLETYKAYEQKPPDLLMEKVDQDFLSQMTNCLTSVKSVNKTNTLSLLSAFGSLASITQASREDLSLCPGIGPQKAKRLFDVLHEPFLKVPRQAEPSLPRGLDKE
ncbi:DNA excision repair protein ERCC-1 [Alligator mississippiensis]|uniref:DNA excision repair protein ERCC-1 n=1 Tax=Alligator mississippiensis TaxID=8496 RepID=A0A151MYI3_ALLMI|nr:DNA excision repair protein ERCC-1 [Alligator mississippiensis]KYO29623.1 DNA excision repair protein ERCC-1 [Alligator mississippiensis]